MGKYRGFGADFLVKSTLVACGAANNARRQNAEGYARDFCRQFKGWSSPVIQCMGDDTDQNGFRTRLTLY